MDEELEHMELRITAASGDGAPIALREATIAQVRRELRAGRLDRRLARVAAALLVAGVGLNVMMGIGDGTGTKLAASSTGGGVRVLAATAAAVAEATDAETGRRVARQMALWNGGTLSAEQAAAIDAALADELHHGKAG